MSRISPSGFILLALLVLTINVQAQVSSSGAAAPAAGVISGRVTKGGQPVPVVAMFIEPFDLSAPKSPLPRAITNDEGKYRMEGVPEGRYTVKPFAPALVVASGPAADKAGMTMSSGVGLSGFVVTVGRGDVLEGIDFTLGAGGVITGRVTDEAGRPVVEVTVECERINERGMTSATSRFQTDDRGIYRIYGLPAGKYLVSVSDYGHLAKRRDRKTFYPDTPDQKRATEVEVTAGGESNGIDIRLSPRQQTYSITGRLIAQDTGRPVTGASISFSGWNDGRQGFMTTDPNGTFKIEDCVMGNYEIKIATTGGPTKGYYTDPVIVQVSDADITDLEVSAIRGATVSGNVIVQGTRDPTIINALTQSSVMSATDRRPGLRGSETVAGAAPIGPDGRFEFTGLRPARLELKPVSMPEGFAFLRIERDGVPQRDLLAVTAGERVTGLRVVVAYGKGSINGQIKVEGGVLPTRMVWMVTVRRADGEGEPLFQMIDGRGQFWVKNLPTALYEITAEADYVEIPGVTPTTYPAPIKQTVTVQNNSESQILMVLDLKGRGKQ